LERPPKPCFGTLKVKKIMPRKQGFRLGTRPKLNRLFTRYEPYTRPLPASFKTKFMQPRLKISEPCNQDWNKMTILEQHKFCSKCQKKIFDFTDYKKEDILKILNTNKNVCGRLDQSQLKKNYFSNNTKNSSIFKLVLFFSLGTVIGFAEPIIAKPKEHKVEQTEIDKWQSVLPIKESDSINIKGTVLDPEGLELPGVNISIKGTDIQTKTDFDGKYSITIPKEKLKEKNYLVFSFIGFEVQEYRFYEKNRYINIKMEEDTVFIGEVVIIRRNNIFYKVGNFFRNLFSN
jgi:hypothetical protein